MSRAHDGKESATLQSTRQILDELDALMDRMLAIPVNDLDDPSLPAVSGPHTPTVSATFTMLDASPEEEAESLFGEETTPTDNSPNYSTDLSEATEPTPLPAPPRESEPKPDPIPEEMISLSIMALTVPAVTAEADVPPVRIPRRALASCCLLHFLWFNQGFDACTLILGGGGRWLRGPRGRHALGLTGLALLAGAGLWLVKDWLGWTW